MNMKTIYYIFSLVLAILMLCTALPLAQGATHVSVTWGPSWYPQPNGSPSTDPLWLKYWNYEQPAQSTTAAYITSIASQAGQNWQATNNYGPNTTNSTVYTHSQLIRGNPAFDFVATFHVGDFYPTNIGGTWHYAYYGSNGASNGILDKDLVSYTSAKNKFSLIWTCANGWVNIPNNINYYYYIDTQYNTGIVGMAYAWTQKSNMGTTGYVSPDNSGVAYIGFENTPKWLSDNSDFKTKNYGDFCREFYSNLFNHNSVNTSLNSAAAYAMGGSQYTFQNTLLCSGYWDSGYLCRMRVLGDGNMILPY
jgi:hypothetical protein